MMNVDVKKCIGCEQCVKDCFPKDIVIIDGKARINNVTCMKCGHCIAVCPQAAISTDEYDMEDVKDYNKEEFSIESDRLLNFIKFRRSVRRFKDIKVEKDQILKIIEAGKFTQTAANMQDVSYIVIEEKLPELKAMAFKALKLMGENMLATIPAENVRHRRTPEMWLTMYDEYVENPKEYDKLFFHAPLVIVISAYNEVNGMLAASNMELMANTLGLGTFFSGFFMAATQTDKEILDFIGVQEHKKAVACMVIGHPDVEYLRTVPRKAAEISWL